jgi:hypothetical protein
LRDKLEDAEEEDKQRRMLFIPPPMDVEDGDVHQQHVDEGMDNWDEL